MARDVDPRMVVGLALVVEQVELDAADAQHRTVLGAAGVPPPLGRPRADESPVGVGRWPRVCVCVCVSDACPAQLTWYVLSTLGYLRENWRTLANWRVFAVVLSLVVSV